ncbi:hypothetical protein lerEdw1_004111 [Lerista edwardsae]|nr:hypothetical protein lerEdw1_004111 [Lerista edwardsae]
MPRQRGETWEHQETTLFLTLFGETKVQEQLNSCHQNQVVYENLAERMNDHGYVRTPHQLRIKVKDLKRKYRHMKENQPNKGHELWKYYHFLDSIYCRDSHVDPEAAASSAAGKDGAPSEGKGRAPQPPDEICSDKSQDRGLPACTSRRLSDASFVASARCSSTAQTPCEYRSHVLKALVSP